MTATSTDDRPRRLQNLLLVWVDANVNSNDPDTLHTLEQLKDVVNDITLTQRPDECMRCLHELKTEKALVISSGSLGQELVPKLHSMENVDSIYIFCKNQEFHEQWSKEWTKIKGVHTKIGPICEALHLSVKQFNRDSISISFIDIAEDDSYDELNRLEPSFMYTQLLKRTLFNMKHEHTEIQNLVTNYRKNFQLSNKESKLVDEFSGTYHPDKAVWWYTRESFIYQMLNQALRLLEGDIIVDMGFFIHDLHQQLEQLHQEQLHKYGGKPFTVYRGQGFTEENFAKLTKNKGGLLGFNCFLSTSQNHATSLEFAEKGASKPDMVGILFVMKIDPNLHRTPFADITNISYYNNEAEILFSMHTVFRIEQIKALNGHNQLFEVQLSLTADDDPQLKALTVHLDKEMGGSGWERVAFILIDMGQTDKAEQLYLTLLEKTSTEPDKGSYNYCLGLIKDRQGSYQKAIQYYEQALAIQRKIVPVNDPSFASIYNQIGQVYLKMGEYPKALSYYEEALAIDKKILPDSHPDLAISYSNLGGVYNNMGEYSKSVSICEQALAIQKKTLPDNHPMLATTYNNLGLAYKNMKEYSKALFNYSKGLDIREKTLPDNHPSLATSYNNIALIYESMENYSKALTLFEKVLYIKQQSLPANHPGIQSVRESINFLKDKL